MRITGGIIKGRQISSPVGGKTRPTTDKLRSALFSILGYGIEGSRVLDAFAGTGAFGIEAYSRGAEYVDFIDRDITSLKMNLSLMKKQSYGMKKGDFFKTASLLNKSYDIIFLDPPYNEYKTSDVLSVIRDNSLLKDNGIIIYEEFYKTEFVSIDEYIIEDERRYGDTIVRFLSCSK